MLVDNGYSNKSIDEIIKNKIDTFNHKNNDNNNDHNNSQNNNNNNTNTPTKPITLYYRNIMNSKHKTDKTIMKNIIKKNINCTDPNQHIKLLIYYKNAKTANLIIKNNTTTDKNPLQQTNVIYQYKCNIDGCDHQTYIGMTTTTLSRRLTCHLTNGGPLLHSEFQHGKKITRENLVSGTEIIDRSINKRTLQILEALHIQEQQPTINKQIKSVYLLPSQTFNLPQQHSITPTTDQTTTN